MTPGNQIGPTVSEASDAIKITYVDPTLDWSAYQAATIAPDGSSLTMPAGDDARGHRSGGRNYDGRRHSVAERVRVSDRRGDRQSVARRLRSAPIR